MNKSFLIIFIPALIVAAMYISLGIYPPARVWIGLGIFAIAIGAYWLRAIRRRGNPEAPGPAAPPATPAAGASASPAGQN